MVWVSKTSKTKEVFKNQRIEDGQVYLCSAAVGRAGQKINLVLHIPIVSFLGG